MISIFKYTRPNEIKLCQGVGIAAGAGSAAGTDAAIAAGLINKDLDVPFTLYDLKNLYHKVTNPIHFWLRDIIDNGNYARILSSPYAPYYSSPTVAETPITVLQPTVVDTGRGYTPVSLNIPVIPNYASLIGQYGDALQLDLMRQRVALQIQEREALALRQLAVLDELHKRQAEFDPISINTNAIVSLPDYLYGDRTLNWIGLGPLLGKIWNGTKKNQETPSKSEEQTSEQTQETATTESLTSEQLPNQSSGNNNNDNNKNNNKFKYGKLALALALAGLPAIMGLIGGIKDIRTKDPSKRSGVELLKYTIPGVIGTGLEYITRGYDYSEEENGILGYDTNGDPVYKNKPKNSSKDNEQNKEYDNSDYL